MKQIEQGCTAIIVNGGSPNSPTTNIGKIVTVGKFIGKANFTCVDDLWEVDKIINYLNGEKEYLCSESFMERIDDEENSEDGSESVDNKITISCKD